MKYIDIAFDKPDTNAIYKTSIIRQGENKASQIRIALSNSFIGYTYTMLLQLNNETPIASGELINTAGVLIFTITNALTNKAGSLKVEIHAYNDELVIVKSAILFMTIRPTLDGTNTTIMPESYVPWYVMAVEESSKAKEQADISKAIADTLSTVTIPNAVDTLQLVAQEQIELAKEQADISKAIADTLSTVTIPNAVDTLQLVGQDKVNLATAQADISKAIADTLSTVTIPNAVDTLQLVAQEQIELAAAQVAQAEEIATLLKTVTIPNAVVDITAAGQDKVNLAAAQAAQAAQAALETADSLVASLLSETNAKTSETNAKTSETNAKTSETNAKTSEGVTLQAMIDYLAMVGINIATLDANGKLTPSQIPALSINDVITVSTVAEIYLLNAQRGDVALIVTNEVVTDSYLLAADAPSIPTNWKKLGMSYVANAGHAVSADAATDSQMINGHRMVTMTQAQYDVAVKDPDTVYLVSSV